MSSASNRAIPKFYDTGQQVYVIQPRPKENGPLFKKKNPSIWRGKWMNLTKLPRDDFRIRNLSPQNFINKFNLEVGIMEIDIYMCI